jgi:hypothetical protein
MSFYRLRIDAIKENAGGDPLHPLAATKKQLQKHFHTLGGVQKKLTTPT